MRYVFVFVLLVNFNQFVFCQNGDYKTTIYKDTSRVEKRTLKISYYGINTFHTGIKVGIEYPIFRKVKEMPRFPMNTRLGIMKNKGIKTIHKDWLASLNFTLYNHKNNHTGLWLTSEFSKRRTGRRGGFKEFSYGLGMLKTFQAATYEVDEFNDVRKISVPGHLYYTFAIGVAYGKDYSIRKQKPVCWYIKPTYYLIFPYNSLFSAGFGLDIGLSFKILDNPFKNRL